MSINRVKELREALHLSQETLGNSVGISQQVISKIERDDRRLTKDNMLVLADFFHVSTDYLIGRSDARRNVEQENEQSARYERNCEIVQLFELLGKKEQLFFRAMLDKMLELKTAREDGDA